jgi:hypothetical protein
MEWVVGPWKGKAQARREGAALTSLWQLTVLPHIITGPKNSGHDYNNAACICASFGAALFPACSGDDASKIEREARERQTVREEEK